MSKRWIKAGSTDQTVDVFIQDSTSTTGGGLTGLVYNSAGLTCYYRKGATGTPTALTLATQTVGGAHSDGGFVAVDGTNTPGQYRLDLSDTMVATAGMLTIYLKGATNMVPRLLELEIVSVDIYDTVRLGLTSLPNVASGNAGAIITSGTGTAQLSTSSGQVLLQSGTGTGQLSFSSGVVSANTVQLSGDSVAADNAESFFDGTGYAGTNNVIPTVTNLTNLPSIPNNWLTAAGIASSALNGKGDWNIGKTGYTLSQAFPANFADLGILPGGQLTSVYFVDHVESLENQAQGEVWEKVREALQSYNLDHLIYSAVDTNFATTVHLDSVIGQLADNGTTATFDRTTDSLEALRDRGDSAWTTGTAAPSVSDIWSNATRTLTSSANIVEGNAVIPMSSAGWVEVDIKDAGGGGIGSNIVSFFEECFNSGSLTVQADIKLIDSQYPYVVEMANFFSTSQAPTDWLGSGGIENGAITEAKIALPAETSGRPTTLLGMVRRLFEWSANKRTRDRDTGTVLLRNAADSATLETQTQSTSGNTDTITKGV